MGSVDGAGVTPRSAGSPTPSSTMGAFWTDAALHSALPSPLAWPQCASWKLRGATSSIRRVAAVHQIRLKLKLWCRSVQHVSSLKACCMCLCQNTHCMALVFFLFACARYWALVLCASSFCTAMLISASCLLCYCKAALVCNGDIEQNCQRRWSCQMESSKVCAFSEAWGFYAKYVFTGRDSAAIFST